MPNGGLFIVTVVYASTDINVRIELLENMVNLACNIKVS